MVFKRKETINGGVNRYKSLRVRFNLCIVGNSKEDVLLFCHGDLTAHVNVLRILYNRGMTRSAKNGTLKVGYLQSGGRRRFFERGVMVESSA